MAMVEKAVVLFMMIMVAAQVSNAAVYTVGDSAGWTTVGNVDYTKWAADKNFQIGDTIVFEYDAKFNNVMRVNRTMYHSCDASAPFKTFTTGKDSIRLTKPGHHFFLCGVPGHCQIGQKVDINIKVPASAQAPKVSPSASAPAPAPTVSPSAPAPTISPWATPVPVDSPVPNTPSPSPSPSNASPLNVGKGAFGFVGLAMTVFSIFYI